MCSSDLFEGDIFVNQNTSDTIQVADYVSQLFPNFGRKEIDGVVEQYEGLGTGTNIFKVNAIMGECELLFFFVLGDSEVADFFGWQRFLFVRRICCYVLLMDVVTRFGVPLIVIVLSFLFFLKGEFAVPPGTHGSDIQYYFPESFVFSFQTKII